MWGTANLSVRISFRSKGILTFEASTRVCSEHLHIGQGFPNWEPRRPGEPRDFARGAAKACGSYCIYCFSRKKLQRMCVVTVLVVFVLLVTKPLFSH